MEEITQLGLWCLALAFVGIVASASVGIHEWLYWNRKTKPLKVTIDWNTHAASLSPSDTEK